MKEAGKFAEASLKALRVSPLKLQKITRAIHGMPVAEAMKNLTFCNLRIAKDVKNLLKSAMANAENNFGMDIDNLYIYRIDTGKAFVMKRFHARGRGRGTRILKPFSNIRIILTEIEA
jgi:large subunit ribosomal protein L22